MLRLHEGLIRGLVVVCLVYSYHSEARNLTEFFVDEPRTPSCEDIAKRLGREIIMVDEMNFSRIDPYK